ncbi:MAG: VCBS repeat-containing protein [Deltaproteobacteria bacterium]|nr:VCBS repeat-containing protein [Deltaproteobacteria bacterium]
MAEEAVAFTVLDAVDQGHVVTCDEVGTFTPTHRYLRDASFAPLDVRRRVLRPTGAPALTRIPINRASLSSSEENPWGAVLIHAEALAPDGLTPTVEGCRCVRLEPDGRSRDPALNLDVLKRCRAFDEGPVKVELEALVPEGVTLSACGAESWVALEGRSSPAPGLCLDVLTCREAPPERPCYECQDESCTELADLSGATVELTLSPFGTFVEPFARTHPSGQVLPELSIDGCSDQFRVTAELPGRPSSRLEIPVECARTVHLEPLVTARLVDPKARISTVPTRERASIAILSKAGSGARLELKRLGERLQTRASLDLPSEPPIDVHAYRDRESREASVALATKGPIDLPIIRRMSILPDSTELTTTRTSSTPCTSVCAESCSDRRACPKSVTGGRLVDADVDLDGKTDLILSSPEGGVAVYGGERTPADDRRCECGSLEAPIRASFDQRNLLGPVLFGGSESGISYQASVPRLAGSRCSLETASCDPGLICQELCDDPFGTCLEPCEVGASVCPARQVCLPSSAGGESGFCTRQTLGCGPERSIIETGGLLDFALGRFGGNGDRDLATLRRVPPGDLSALEILVDELDAMPADRLRVSEEPGSVALAVSEVNGDGFDDLAVLNEPEPGFASIDLWIGRGRASLSRIRGPTFRCSGLRPELRTADFDGDGRQDFVVVCEDEPPSLLLFSARPSTDRPDVNFGAPRILSAAKRTVPVALALGDLGGDDDTDLIALSCETIGPGSCSLESSSSPGPARLTIFEDVATSARAVEVSDDLGVAPSGLEVGAFSRDGREEIAVLGGRQADCSSGRCEHSTLRIWDPTTQVVTASTTLAVENAVGLAGIRGNEGERLELLTIGRGRRGPGRTCALAPECLPHELGACGRLEECGCPPEEVCECDGDECGGIGECVPASRSLSLVRANGSQLLEWSSCKEPLLECARGPEVTSACRCRGEPEAECERDECGCLVPRRIRLGPVGAAPLGFDLAAASLGTEELVVVATDRGLVTLGRNAESLAYSSTIPVGPASSVRLGNLHDGSGADLAFLSRESCVSDRLPGCPALEPPATGRGCLGVLALGEAGSVRDDQCARRTLEYVPSALCVGDFDGNGLSDLAVSSAETSVIELFLFSAEQRQRTTVPSLASPLHLRLPEDLVGGPLRCGDLNGDRRTDVVVASQNGEIAVFLSQP